MTLPRMRLAIVTSSYWPREGGAERQLRDVFGEPGLGDKVEVRVFTESLPDSPTHERVGNAEVFRAGRGLNASALVGPRYGLRTLPRLLSWNPDIVISSQLGVATLAAGLHARARRIPHIIRLSGARIVHHPDGTFSADHLAQSSRHGLAVRWLLGYEGLTIVAPARHMLDAVRNQAPISADRLRRIPNGVPDPSRTPAAGRAGQDHDVVWYGRNDWLKNPEALIALARQTPDLRFVALGRADLPPLANVKNLGWVDDPEPLITGARATLLTSRYEGSPNFALQSLALGVPVAGFEIPALAELSSIHPGRLFLAKAENIEDLRRAVHAACDKGQQKPTSVSTLSEVRREWSDLIGGLIN